MLLELPSAAIHVWCCCTQGVPLTDWERLAQGILDPSEWAALPDLAPEPGRIAPLAGRLILRHLLSRYAGSPPSQWRFERTPHGRPMVVTPTLEPPLFFSVSHTNGLVAVALARFSELGVDVEREDRSLRVDGLARRHCSPGERRDLDGLEPGGRSARLLRFWTLKEAFAKARGSGLRFSLQHADFSGAPDAGRVEARIDGSLGEEAAWHFQTLSWLGSPKQHDRASRPAEYRLALAWQGDPALQPSLMELETDQLESELD